jgi:proteasome accessory factor C
MTSVERAPREAGFSKDADKLIRRLSLVALLLSRQGQPVTTAEIRMKVEGYPAMTAEAFKRRFYEDRSELAELGIAIVTERDPDGGELYSLPPDTYYLTAFELSPDELAALAACLAVLERRFAYSQPLRLALLSLAQGRPELLADAAAPPLAVVTGAEPRSTARALPKLQAAVADRKTVVFDYYAISRDEVRTRTVDPYGLQLVADEWYLVGRCHLREDLRTFRLSRIRSRVTHATRAPHDFVRPAEFDLAAFRDRPPWQLDAAVARARIAVDASLSWWVEARYGHCGELTPTPEGGIVYETPYASPRPLLSWVLGLGSAAELLEPAALRASLAAQLRDLQTLLAAPPPDGPPDGPSLPAPTPVGRGPRHERHGDGRIEVDRFTRLAGLTTYLLRHCESEGEGELDAERVCADLGVSATELRADVRLLNLVNFGADGSLLYAEFKGRRRLAVSVDLAAGPFRRPARLSPLEADTLLLAIELVGGQLPAEHGHALKSAAAKLRSVRSGAPTVAAGTLVGDDPVLDAVNLAVKERRLLEIEYWTEGTGRITTRAVEPHLLVRGRGEWYYVAWCRSAAGRRVFRIATTKRARVLEQHFTPRPDLGLEFYRREGIPSSASYAPRRADVWYSPAVARWVSERQPVRWLTDGAAIARQPYVEVGWLTRSLLRVAGEARPLAPPEAVDDLRAAVEDLLERYGGA